MLILINVLRHLPDQTSGYNVQSRKHVLSSCNKHYLFIFIAEPFSKTVLFTYVPRNANFVLNLHVQYCIYVYQYGSAM